MGQRFSMTRNPLKLKEGLESRGIGRREGGEPGRGPGRQMELKVKNPDRKLEKFYGNRWKIGRKIGEREEIRDGWLRIEKKKKKKKWDFYEPLVVLDR